MDHPNANPAPAAPAKPETGGAPAPDAFASIVAPDLGEGPEAGSEGLEGEAAPGAEGEAPAPAAPARVYAGRFKTVEELEHAYDSSGKEARRILEHATSLEKQYQETRTKAAQLEDELKRRAPAFKVLAPEEEAKLKNEDTAGYVEYVLKKERHEREEAEARRSFAAKQEQEAAEESRIAASIEQQHDSMLADPKKYPKYRELTGVAGKLLDLVPSLRGQEAAPKVLYYAAYGLAALQAAEKARAAEEASRAAAAGEAGALADKGGAGGRGGNAAPGAGKTDDLNSRIIKAGTGFRLPSFTS